MKTSDLPDGFRDMQSFGLVEALLGRRSRRFFKGAEIPDGVLKFKSRFEPMPLTELEKLLVVAACGGNTAWHHMIFRADRYAPHLSNYAAAAGGRTFPSSAGFHTSMTFFTDDEGVYVLDARDAPAFAERAEDGTLDPGAFLEAMRGRVKKFRDGRLQLPSTVPYVEAHNTWVVNHPGTLLVTPVGDLSQHVLLNLCYMLQNGLVLTDDIHGRPIPGIETFKGIVDVANTWPLTFVEQWSLAELTTELATGCYAGALMLQAMGLGGWMFNGIDAFAFLGASGNPDVPGLGFRYDTDERWPYPNPTGLAGVMEGYCPPITRTCVPPWMPSASGNSAPAVLSIPTPPARGRIPGRSAPPPGSTARNSASAWPCRPSTSSTPSGNSRARCPPSSSSCTFRRTTSTWSSTTGSSGRDPT